MLTRILFVDDETSFREPVTQLLQAEGFDVTCAGDGIEALALLNRSHYDVILLDVYMPRMNGIEMLQQMKDQGIHSHVIMLTAETDVDKAVDTLKLGVDDYLTKPYFHKHLIACIERVLAKGKTEPHIE